MIELDGIEYQVESAETNAATMAQSINDYAEANNVTDAHGDVIKMEINWANPLYMFLYGVGVLFSYLQNLVYSAGCAVSIPNSSPRQLLNIADMCNVKRRKATKTSINATVFANLSTEQNPVECRITTEDVCSVATSEGTKVFRPAFDVTIPIESSRNVVFLCDEEGSFSIPANTIAFDEAPAGYRTMLSQPSVPGQQQETIPALRQRLQRRTTEGTQVDRAIADIEQLEGVSVCNIYFNRSIRDTEYVDGIAVPPRQALVFVQGWSNDIAKTFYNHMMCQCAGSDAPTAVQQDWITRSGQHLPVYIIPPKYVNVMIRVYVNNVIPDIEKTAMQDMVATLAQKLTIGEMLMSTDVLNVLQENFASYTFGGCQLSLDGTAWTHQVQPASNELLVFTYTGTQIIGQNV